MQLCQGYPSYVVHMLNGLLYIDGDEITDDMRSNDYSWQQNKGTALHCKCILCIVSVTVPQIS